MKLTLEKNRKTMNSEHELYAIGKYKVDVATYKEGNRFVRVYVSERDRYTPDIFCIDNFEGDVIRFDIQTTSYGAISPDEIRKVIEGYNEAVKVAEFLTKEFVEM